METTPSTPSSASRPTFCTSCGASLTASPHARFCGMCGVSLTGAAPIYPPRPALSGKQWAAIAVVTFGLFIPIAWFNHRQTGIVPTESGAEMMKASEEPLEIPAQFKAAQEAAANAPKDLKLQNEYAAILVELIRTSKEEPSQTLILEAVEQLSKVLALNPLEPDALLSLADISFNQQIFNKAAELYQRFLALRPNDEDVRTRYGSSLMFQGEFDKSIAQQKMVLAKNPKSFQASAYLAIAIGQKGEIAEARKAAKRALELAPNEEAKKRLNAFLESLDKKKEGVAATQAQPRQETGTVVPEGAVSFEQALRSNLVAGPKVAAIQRDGTTATVTMKEFPMQAMPPFAKEKFFSSLAEAARNDKLQTIIFIDQASGKEMERKNF